MGLIEMNDYFYNILNICQRMDTYSCKLPDQGFSREVLQLQTHYIDLEMAQNYYQSLKDIEDIKGLLIVRSAVVGCFSHPCVGTSRIENDRINLYKVVKSILSYVLLVRVFRLLRSSSVIMAKHNGLLSCFLLIDLYRSPGAIFLCIISLRMFVIISKTRPSRA
jgi:hypothetical protein